MSGVKFNKPKGVLKKGWYSAVGDYAIDGGWSRNGTLLIVGDSAGGVYAFDGRSGKIAWQKSETHGAGLLKMAFHPDGEVFASAGQDGKVLICHALDGRLNQAIELGNGWADNVSWSPDGQWLAVSISRRIFVYNVNGQEAWRSDDHPSTVSAILWSGNHEIATACYGQVTFYEATTGEVKQQLQWRGSLVSMALSPDGDIVACGSQDNSVHFWRRSTGQDSEMRGYPTKPSNLAFDHTGTLLATGGSSVVMVWSFQGDGPEGTSPGMLDFHVQPITALSFMPGRKRLASGARDGGVIIWSLQDNGEGRIVGGSLVRAGVSELLWKPNGRALAALDANGGVTTWRLKS